MLKKLLLGLFVTTALLAGIGILTETRAQGQAADPRPRPRPKRDDSKKKSAPPVRQAAPSSVGYTISGNSVQLKKGYRFVQINPKTISVQDSQSHNTVGTFECNCLIEGGSCFPKVRGTSMKCTSGSDCRDNCQIRLIYGGISSETVLR